MELGTPEIALMVSAAALLWNVVQAHKSARKTEVARLETKIDSLSDRLQKCERMRDILAARLGVTNEEL